MNIYAKIFGARINLIYTALTDLDCISQKYLSQLILTANRKNIMALYKMRKFFVWNQDDIKTKNLLPPHQIDLKWVKN